MGEEQRRQSGKGASRGHSLCVSCVTACFMCLLCVSCIGMVFSSSIVFHLFHEAAERERGFMGPLITVFHVSLFVSCFSYVFHVWECFFFFNCVSFVS